MRRRFQVCALLGTLLIASRAAAQLSGTDPHCVISNVGYESFLVTTGEELLSDGFAVRVTNDTGTPLEGLKVWFFVNTPVPIPGINQLLPPQATYGHFLGPSLDLPTDRQGMARSPAFVAGTLNGNYEVVAMVFASTSGGVCPFTVHSEFQIQQAFGATIPATSPWSWLLLSMLLLGGTALTRRRRS